MIPFDLSLVIIASFHLIVVGILTLARPTNFATPQGLLSEVLILVRVSTVQSLYGYRRFEHHLLFHSTNYLYFVRVPDLGVCCRE